MGLSVGNRPEFVTGPNSLKGWAPTEVRVFGGRSPLTWELNQLDCFVTEVRHETARKLVDNPLP